MVDELFTHQTINLLGMKILFLFASVLIASTYNARISNEQGYIGIRTEDDTGTRAIERVRFWSPADYAGLKAQDVILACDGVKGGSIIGAAYTVATVLIKRKDQEMTFRVVRLPLRIIKQREQMYFYNCGFEPDTPRPAFEDLSPSN